MGNILADCQRCTIIDKCDVCTEVLTIRTGNRSGGTTRHASVSEAGSAAGQTGGTGNGSLNRSSSRLRQSSADGPSVAAFTVDEDAAIAAAIAASYGTGGTGGGLSEEELVAQAIRNERLQEESRQRAMLREEQENEYEESLRIDQQRELEKAQKRKEEEEEARRVAAEEEAHRERAETEAAEAAEVEAAKKQKIQGIIEEAKKQLSVEPGKEAEGIVQVMIRMPHGRRVQRAFLTSDVVAQLYHFANVEGGEVEDEHALAGLLYRLVSSMPRRVYEDRDATLEAEGIKGKCALLVEVLDDDEPQAA